MVFHKGMEVGVSVVGKIIRKTIIASMTVTENNKFRVLVKRDDCGVFKSLVKAFFGSHTYVNVKKILTHCTLNVRAALPKSFYILNCQLQHPKYNLSYLVKLILIFSSYLLC